VFVADDLLYPLTSEDTRINQNQRIILQISTPFDTFLSVQDHTRTKSIKMLMPTKDRAAIYEYILNEGVMVAKKDMFANKHMVLAVKNLYVIKTMQSLRSRSYVQERVSWSHYYWYLTNEGIQYLRDYLHLPPEVVPATLKNKARVPSTETGRLGRQPTGPQTEGKSAEQARTESSYRREDNNVQLRGGFGRGRGPAPTNN